MLLSRLEPATLAVHSVHLLHRWVHHPTALLIRRLHLLRIHEDHRVLVALHALHVALHALHALDVLGHALLHGHPLRAGHLTGHHRVHSLLLHHLLLLLLAAGALLPLALRHHVLALGLPLRTLSVRSHGRLGKALLLRRPRGLLHVLARVA